MSEEQPLKASMEEVSGNDLTSLPRPTEQTQVGGFFRDEHGAAVLKHTIIRQYLHPFASKVGKNSPGNQVAYLDGYAGPGVYDDGSPGSPALAAATASKISSFRNLKCFYIEKDRDLFYRLQEALRGVSHEAVTYLGDVEEHLESVLAACHGLPLLAFLDPFGLGVSFKTLEEKLLARSLRMGAHRGGPITEVLLTFSLPGLRRNAGHLLSEKTHPRYLLARNTILTRVDATLGGDWWREIWASGEEDREGKIVLEYINRLRALTGGWAYGAIEVRNRTDGAVVYHLIFLSQSNHGIWQFAEAVSLAQQVWNEFCNAGQIGLLVDDDDWIARIAGNIEAILSEGKRFKVLDRMVDVYGDTIGLARGTHVRRAIKKLNAVGKTPSTGIGGSPEKLVVEPPTNS